MSEERERGDPDAASPPPPSSYRPGARYSAIVGVAFIGLIAVAVFNAAQTDQGTLLGIEDVRGEPLPEFAVPDIRGPLVGDANVAQDDCETSRNPCPVDERRDPACEIEPRGAIRVCDLFDRPLVLSFWFTRGADCVRVQDTVDQVARDYGDRVNFLALNIRDEREQVVRVTEERGWEIPVGWDRDGAVSNIYRIGVCPTIAYAYPGGIFHRAEIVETELTTSALRGRVEELITASRRRAAGSGSR